MRMRVLFTVVFLALIASRAVALDRSLYVLNGLAETLSRVNLTTGVVSNNIQVLGLVPNQIAIDNTGRRDGVAYVVNSTGDDLQMVQLEPVALLKTIELGEGRNPYSLAFLNDSVVAVSNLLANTVSEVNTRSGVVDTEYAVGAAPEGMVYHGGELFVCLTAFDFGTFAYGQGQVAVVQPDSNRVVATINVGTNPQSAVVDYEGHLLVLCTGDFFSTFGMIYVIDPTTHMAIDSISTGGSPGHMALSPDGLAYIAAGGFTGHGDVYVFNSHTRAMVRNSANPIAVGIGSVAVAADILANGYSCGFSVDQVNRITSGAVNLNYAVGDGPGFAAVYEPLPPGDVDGSGSVTSADIIFLVNYLFKGGAAPVSLALADVNRNCQSSVSDAVTVVNYVFRAGKRLEYGCW
jgi:DNA-binding beta-propeller fold protein YncE